MGANPTQAMGVMVFLFACTMMAAGFTLGGNPLLIFLGVALMAVSAGIFRKAKPWEKGDRT